MELLELLVQNENSLIRLEHIFGNFDCLDDLESYLKMAMKIDPNSSYVLDRNKIIKHIAHKLLVIMYGIQYTVYSGLRAYYFLHL